MISVYNKELSASEADLGGIQLTETSSFRFVHKTVHFCPACIFDTLRVVQRSFALTP